LSVPIPLHSMTLHFPDGTEKVIEAQGEGLDGFYRVSELKSHIKTLIQHEVFIINVVSPDESSPH